MTVTIVNREYPEPQTFSKAVKMKCMDCAAGSFKELKLCPVEDCPLWRFRFGILPKTATKRGYNVKKHIDLETEERLREARKRGTKEQREAAGERLRAAIGRKKPQNKI